MQRIWFSKKNKHISYPKEGNINCYQIEQDSFWFKHRNNCIIKTVKIYSPNETFFDIGGGNGYVAKGLEENNIQTVLVEPGIAGALNAKERGLKNIICSSFEDVGFKTNIVNAIGLFDVVEHIEDDGKFLKSINSILTNGGLVYIAVPAFNLLWSNDDIETLHFKRYTIRQMRKLLKEAGFKIEFATYIFSILPIPIFLFRTIPSLLGLKRASIGLNKHKRENSQEKGVLTNILEKIWNKELNYIKQKWKIPIGGSCFIVARKIVANK